MGYGTIFINSETDYIPVPFKPKQTKEFLVREFSFSDKIEVVEGEEKGIFSSTVNISKEKHLTILWGGWVTLRLTGFSQEENILKKIRRFCSEGGVYPRDVSGTLVFDIDRDWFTLEVEEIVNAR